MKYLSAIGVLLVVGMCIGGYVFVDGIVEKNKQLEVSLTQTKDALKSLSETIEYEQEQRARQKEIVDGLFDKLSKQKASINTKQASASVIINKPVSDSVDEHALNIIYKDLLQCFSNDC